MYIIVGKEKHPCEVLVLPRKMHIQESLKQRCTYSAIHSGWRHSKYVYKMNAVVSLTMVSL